MAITKLGDYVSSALQQSQDTASKVASDDKTNVGRDVSATTDRVEISKEAQEMAKVSKVAPDENDIRTEVVDRIRGSINDGSYTISADKIAAKMMEEIW